MVIEIRIGYNELVKRITGRRLCPKCGAIFNVYSQPPKIPDICDFCRTRLVVRTDDREEVLGERLRTYEEETRPVFEVLQAAGKKIHSIDGSLPEHEVSERIFRILNYG